MYNYNGRELDMMTYVLSLFSLLTNKPKLESLTKCLRTSIVNRNSYLVFLTVFFFKISVKLI